MLCASVQQYPEKTSSLIKLCRRAALVRVGVSCQERGSGRGGRERAEGGRERGGGRARELGKEVEEVGERPGEGNAHWDSSGEGPRTCLVNLKGVSFPFTHLATIDSILP